MLPAKFGTLNIDVNTAQIKEAIGRLDTSKAGLKQTFLTFEGRLPQFHYWLLVAVFIALYIPIIILGSILGSFVTILLLPLIWPGIAVQVKRLHDLGFTGWLALINLVPVIGGLVMLIWLGFFKGSDEPNAYGPPVRA